MKLLLAIFVGKSIFFLTRLLSKGGGSAAPGLYALKIDSDLIEKLTVSIPKNIIITGTNGKTTTARLLAHFARSQNIKVLRNQTGSNLERGIASTLISRANFFGGIRNIDLGIWELDEAAFNTAALKLQPQVIVFLNALRDQLDRYGEVDNVVKKWKNTLKKVNQKTYLIVNGDDTNTSGLLNSFKGHIETFGVKDHKIKGENANTGINTKLKYEAKNIKQKALSSTSFELTLNRKPYTINLPLPGIYHIYDFLAAFSTGLQLGFAPNAMVESLKSFSPAFGRFEKLNIQGIESYIFLIKNPAGATEVFKTISSNIKKNDQLLICLNDNFADGTDVSWIWDASFEEFQISNYKFKILSTGTRAYDLAVRLKYAGIEPERIQVQENLEQALEEAKRGNKGRLFILPTYTALLDLQKILTRRGVKGHYWKEGEV